MKTQEMLFHNKWKLTLLALWGLYLLILSNTNTWNYVGVPVISEIKFADLHAILSAIECHKSNYDVFFTNPCDPMGRLHVYGKTWLLLGLTGLSSQDVNWLGYLITTVFVLYTISIVNPSNFLEFTICTFILLSPAVTLGLERANNDLIIFTILGLSLFFLAKKLRIVSFIFIYTAILLKIYPAIILWILPLASQRKIEFYFTLLAAILLTTTWLITNADELITLSQIVPRPTGNFVTGAKEIFEIIKINNVSISIKVLILTISAFIISLIISNNIKKQLINLKVNHNKQLFFLLGYSVLISTFFLNSNYDYRWIFATMTLPYFFSIWKRGKVFCKLNSFILIYFIFLLFVLWSELLMGASYYSLDHSFILNLNFIRLQLYIGMMPLIKKVSAWGSLLLLTAFALNLPIVNKNYITSLFKLNWRI